MLAVRTKGLAPQSEGRGHEGKGRWWDSQSSREILLYGRDENNKMGKGRGMRKERQGDKDRK